MFFAEYFSILQKNRFTVAKPKADNKLYIAKLRNPLKSTRGEQEWQAMKADA